MGVFRTSIDVELAIHLRAETILRQHATHRFLNDLLWSLFHELSRRRERRATRISGMTEIHLGREFLACKYRLLRVDHDDEIARVNMRRERRLILAAKHLGNFRSQSTYRLAGSVVNLRLAIDIRCIRHKCRHLANPPSTYCNALFS